MQNCSSCGILLTEDTGYKKTETKWQAKCKSCFNAYCIDRWQKRKMEAIEYKGGKCQNCGYNKYYGALEFHHLNPKEKDFDWGKLRKRSWPDIKNELDKCVCLCANCHREVHANAHVV